MKAHANATGCRRLPSRVWSAGVWLALLGCPAGMAAQTPLAITDQHIEMLPPPASAQPPPGKTLPGQTPFVPDNRVAPPPVDKGATTPPLRAPVPGQTRPSNLPPVIPVIPPRSPQVPKPAQPAATHWTRPAAQATTSVPPLLTLAILPDIGPETLPVASPATTTPGLPAGNITQTPPNTAPANASPPNASPANALPPNAVLISLDAVLRLAHDQNGAIRLAREKLHEAYIEHELAGKRWIPDLTVGVGAWRHEGGIQDFDGRLLDSSYGSVLGGLELRGKIDLRDAVYTRLETQRKIWHQKGELSRFSTDQLLDAAGTYVDLLMARGAEAIAREAETKLRDLLEQAQKLAKIDPGVQVEVSRVESELGAQRILTRRLRENVASASAKLIYVLGLDPRSELIVTERQLVAFRLVEVAHTDALVEQALREGPGVRELEAILGILEESRCKQQSAMHLLPTFELRMVEGAFGAGPGSRMDWENRWDLGVQARWNLTEFLGSGQRKRLADSKIEQAHLGYHDLRGKLTLGVREAAEAHKSGQEQMTLAARQIQHAEETLRLSDMRLRENIKGRSPSEVLLAIRALVGARISYLHAVRDFDKAQLRLFVLTGGVTTE
jgi:outer membrane protein TolC